ncbi:MULTISPECIES: primosomal protein N' [Acidobacterium]|uniref:Replication restart protein PriA n=1 Tax=Acidobacterium capsulatum (strain ATCC 51196 / DSM 11244 / BCRC 80197 / JCM 7670 / NBRC 15755 / NCIMB 13165 / 161) TaxID=240015 RepID=C1F1L0_ACIC5|nr:MULTISPECIES: primosomal protein N' [Acidobacterium]ACO34403.1 primosomal protein N' [Acidobacterium capsulatum ATCC 51196]HCT61368.1 primosomal protein N' [Acidobacterium sp.]
MPAFCDVALPVPLDRAFTYSTGLFAPEVGARVLVPFRNEKLSGIVLRLHDDPPPVEAKPLLAVMDEQSILSPQLLDLARWIAQYYVAPIGEVLRAMLPLIAEVRRHVLYRITDTGREALFAGAQQGSSRRSRLPAAEQDREYAVLNYLESGDPARVSAIRSKTGASIDLLRGMLRKKWLARETAAETRTAQRTMRVARLAQSLDGEARLPRLNENQQTILAALAGIDGGVPVAQLRELDVPDSTLGTLVRRGLVAIEERPVDFLMSGLSIRHHGEHKLIEAQQQALAQITGSVEEGGFRPYLLHGVTGSGKTAVYLAAMRHALERGKSSILLVPEIGLTPQMAAQLHRAFGSEVALLHSALLPEERAEQWHRIRRREARVVVGTRSAIFAPVEDLGLILVDEEHDGSYKQESVPRYHARDVAVMRAKLAGATVVLGSATPSLESWNNAIEGKYTRIEMHERIHQRPMPEVELVDMRREFQETGAEHLFSRTLIDQTQATLDRGEQAIVLLNRRGYSFVVLCRACGEKLQCENCSISLTYHKAVTDAEAHAPVGQRLECHYCGYKRTIPQRCPKCDSEHLYFLGAGSQQGEERLQEIFPGARIGRMDRDTVRGRGDLERLLAKLHSGEINLLVGTQMIAKGHDIHGVTLVGVVGADHALGLPDFRAAERTFQLLTQVAGRAGRGELPGKVIVQTYYPEHYAVECARQHDFHSFAERELKYRRWMRYPPYAAITNVLLQSEDFGQLAHWAAALGRWLSAAEFPDVRVLGPATAPIARIKRMHRMHLLLKSQSRQSLQRVLRLLRHHAEEVGIPPRNLIIDVDAVHLM